MSEELRIEQNSHAPKPAVPEDGRTALNTCRSVAGFPDAVARRHLMARDQQDVDPLVIIGLVMAVDQHFAPARGQRDEIFVLDQQPSAVSHMDEKGAEGLGVKQPPDFIRFHGIHPNQKPDPRKERRGAHELLLSTHHPQPTTAK